jgi:hypothetical protein
MNDTPDTFRAFEDNFMVSRILDYHLAKNPWGTAVVDRHASSHDEKRHRLDVGSEIASVLQRQ